MQFVFNNIEKLYNKNKNKNNDIYPINNNDPFLGKLPIKNNDFQQFKFNCEINNNTNTNTNTNHPFCIACKNGNLEDVKKYYKTIDINNISLYYKYGIDIALENQYIDIINWLNIYVKPNIK